MHLSLNGFVAGPNGIFFATACGVYPVPPDSYRDGGRIAKVFASPNRGG